ncbi:MAG: CoA transferase [Hyphomicrobiaceae bacterium]
MADEDLPFEGVKVLDLSQGVAGPYCAMMLARNGADVVKLEPPGAGCWSRQLGKFTGDHTAHSLVVHRGKRSLALDLKSEAGVGIARQLAKDANIVIHNYRIGKIDKFGLDYPTLAKTNPQVVYAWITGFGPKGPNVELPATDSVMQAFTGMMSINRDKDGLPQRINMLAIDFATGLYAFQAVAAALYGQAMKGKGKFITTSLLESSIVYQEAAIIESHLQKGNVEPIGMPVGTFKTRNGYMSLNARRQPQFEAFAKLVGHAEWIEDARFKDPRVRVENGDALMALIRPIIAERTTEDWDQALSAADVLHAKVHTHEDLFDNVQVNAVDALTWVDDPTLGRVPFGSIAGQAAPRTGCRLSHSPGLGEHSREVLSELGLSASQIDALVAAERCRHRRRAECRRFAIDALPRAQIICRRSAVRTLLPHDHQNSSIGLVGLRQLAEPLMSMRKMGPAGLAMGLCVVVTLAASALARADDCSSGAAGSGGVGCAASDATAGDVSYVPSAAPLSATIGDEQTTLDAGPQLDLSDSVLAGDVGAREVLPGLHVTEPTSSMTPDLPATGLTSLGTWRKLEMERVGESALTRSGVGWNYKASRSATLGMSLESEERNADVSLTEQTRMAATFGLKPSPLLSFEAKAAWAQQSAGDVASRDIQSAQNELSARLSGDWRVGAFKVAPNVTVAHAQDGGGTDVATTGLGTVVVAPTISRPVTLDGAKALEPFLTFKQEMEINGLSLQAGAPVLTETGRSAGGGVKLEKKDAYSLSVTTDVENLDAEHRSLKSQLRLSVPLK